MEESQLQIQFQRICKRSFEIDTVQQKSVEGQFFYKLTKLA